MANEKKEIVFAESMTADKRNKDFAYLRKNLFTSRTPGLYPSRNFTREMSTQFIDDDTIEEILGSEERSPSGQNYKIKVIYSRAGNLRFRDYRTGASNTGLSGVDFNCGVFGTDGVYVNVGANKVYHDQHVNTNTTLMATLTGAIPDIAAFDGLYYWWVSDNEIYKQLSGSNTVTVAFNDLGFTPRFVDFLNDKMVIFGELAGGIIVVFWDKSDADLFDKRVFIPNSRLIAAGTINGRLMLVRGTGNSSNAKERMGEIIISGYDGEKFVRMNAIISGQKDAQYEDEKGVARGSETMLFSISDNNDSHNDDLYENYIYRVKSDGGIDVLTLPDDGLYGEAHIVRVFYNFSLFATRGDGTEPPYVFSNEETDDGYDDYTEYTTTEYISNFYCERYNLHKLEGLLVAFEKLFGTTDDPDAPTTGEELDIYYRVSDRDEFTLLGTVTAQKVLDNVNARRDQSAEYADADVGLPEQRYVITKLPDGASLPEFNEIQFKFVSLRGFSVTGAWFSYSYLTRITLP